MTLDELVPLLRCPETLAPLSLRGDVLSTADGARVYPIEDGIPRLAFPAATEGSDRRWQRFYDVLAPLYDWGERVSGRLLAGANVEAERQAVVEWLGLKPKQLVLEVSPGPGVFTRHIASRLGPEGRLVAMDLSLGMLRACRKNTRAATPPPALVQGNASHLPFAEGRFDLAFHFGGINLFTDPRRALDELVRVARPGGRVAGGDEYVPPAERHGLRHRIATRLNPGFLREPPALPAGVRIISQHTVYEGFAFLIVAEKL